MRHHVAVVSFGFHAPDLQGQLIKSSAVIHWLLAQGHRVSVLAAVQPGWEGVDRQVQALRRLGAEVETFPVPAARPRAALARAAWLLRRQPVEAYFPSRPAWAAVHRRLDALMPDVLLLLHYGGLALAHDYDRTPKMVLFTDPLHLVAYYDWRYAFGRDRWTVWLWRGANVLKMRREQVPYLAAMIRRCQASGAVAAHHAAWYARISGRPCRYLATPVTDAAGPGWRALRCEAPEDRPRKILWVSPLGAPVNLPAIGLTVRHIIPGLNRRWGPDRYQLHFVGRPDGLPQSLARLAARDPQVKIRGFVESVDEEFLSADVVLVPTPITLGFRNRIASALSYGCCVVSHTANRAGMPELVHEDNVLMAGDGPGLVTQIIRALSDHPLRHRLQQRARATFEHSYADTVCERTAAELFRVAAPRPAERALAAAEARGRDAG